jgi:hypothetical protein
LAFRKPVSVIPTNLKLPPIDNRHLLLNGKVKPTLTEGHDFFLIAPPVWAFSKAGTTPNLKFLWRSLPIL